MHGYSQQGLQPAFDRFSAACSDVSESFLSSQSHNPFESESSKLFESSQRRVTRTVESLRVIGLQARVNVELNEI